MESPLPTYSIYGEQGQDLGVDWLHCESITERSRLHDWEIRPHRHELLYQLFWIERGPCEASLDGRLYQVQGPALLLLPPSVMHGFRFDPEVQGQVITVLGQHLRKLLAEEPRLERQISAARAISLDEASDVERIARAALGLRDEFRTTQAWRSLAIDAALLGLLVACARALPAEGQPQLLSNRAQEHVQRYQTLVEQEFRRQPALSACAARLGITSTQLNRVCQQVLGCSALALLQARLLLEAQRELAYTSMSIKQIAHGLGFADAAYFTRFYQRHTGVAPSSWRLRSAQHLAA